MYDVIIIGGGPAGYSCGIYCARFNLKTLVITKERGGLITKTHLIENWPGEKSISGFDLAQKFEGHAQKLGVEISDDDILEIKKEKFNDEKTKQEKDVFKLRSSDNSYESKCVVFATGTVRKKLNIAGEDKFLGKGVSYCATCDAAFFKNKTVAVIGGSDSAVKEAIYLTEFAKKVYIIYRNEYPRAEDIIISNMKKKIAEGKIELVMKTLPVEILGDKKVEKIILDTKQEISLDGIFVAIGSVPNTVFAKNLDVNLNEKEEIIIDKFGKTNVQGLFAAGDVTDNPFKQIITASAQGVMCAKSCYDMLKQK
jgi:thioredoxin reductase (NADPH)